MGSSTRAVTGGGSYLRRYQEVMVGSRSLARTLFFEFCTSLAPVPGALGLALRKLFWPRLFGSCGPHAQFGPGIVLRHPNRIHLGARVVLSEGCVLDARNETTEHALVLEDDVVVSPYACLQCKGASMRIGRRCGVGLQSVLSATDGNDLAIGADVAIAPRCVLGGGDYYTDQLDQPMSRQVIKPGFPVVLEDDIWLGSGAVVLGGVRIGHGSIVGAGAVVTRDVAPYTVCAGVPARPIKRRRDTTARSTSTAHAAGR